MELILILQKKGQGIGAAIPDPSFLVQLSQLRSQHRAHPKFHRRKRPASVRTAPLKSPVKIFAYLPIQYLLPWILGCPFEVQRPALPRRGALWLGEQPRTNQAVQPRRPARVAVPHRRLALGHGRRLLYELC